MAMSETLSGVQPIYGLEPIPIAQGQMGMESGVRMMEAAKPGQALAHRSSTTAGTYKDAFVIGNASARAEFWGVLVTKGSAPTMAVPVYAGNDDEVSVIWAGHAPVLVAPGETVRRGQFLEPITQGDNRGMWRPVQAGGRGPAQAVGDLDNSAGTEGKSCSAMILPRPNGAGLVSAIVANTAALSLNAETVFAASAVLAPANGLGVGDVYRVTAKVRCTAGAAGNTLVIRSRLNSAAGVLLADSTSYDPAADDFIFLQYLIVIRTLGAGGTLNSAGISVAATNAKATGSAINAAIDTTAANTIVVTADWNADTADAAVLESLVVEKLS